MTYIQIIEMHTTKFDEVQALEEAWEQATGDRRTLRRQIVTRDHNDPDRYLIIAIFDSYESAMENSSLPETGEIAGKMMALTDRPPTFHDLDVIDERG